MRRTTPLGVIEKIDLIKKNQYLINTTTNRDSVSMVADYLVVSSI
jgi:hypothetical protein